MKQFIYLISPSRPTFASDATPDEIAIVGRHFGYLQQKLAEGQVILVGRTQDEPPLGICIFEAESEEAAKEFFESDPAVVQGIFRGEVRPYAVALMRGTS